MKFLTAVSIVMVCLLEMGCERNTHKGHEYVDLGLPSGTLWATCNVGAEAPEAYGGYFAWGETQPKETYNWENYKHAKGASDELTKYCTTSKYGYKGRHDDLTALEPDDDAAAANWGGDWTTPSKVQWEELIDNTTDLWTTINGVKGHLFTATNGNSIFLPAADEFGSNDSYGREPSTEYWSSSLRMDFPVNALYFSASSYGDGCFIEKLKNRQHGLPVRPVLVPRQKRIPKASPESYTGTRDGHEYVDLGLPSGTLWATCNIGADRPEDYGGYYACGETETKDLYHWINYKHCYGEHDELTRYCYDANYGYNGYTDEWTTLKSFDDAAAVNWKGEWHIPTLEQWEELIENTDCSMGFRNDVKGFLFVAKNGANIFLPAAGGRDDRYTIDKPGVSGYYWSSTIYTGSPTAFRGFFFKNGAYDLRSFTRSSGISVRPVWSEE